MIDQTASRRFVFMFLIVVLGGLIFVRWGHRDIYPLESNSIQTQLKRFSDVFYYVNRYYVEAPDQEKIVTGAIQGMLSELDPHSVYIPRERLERVTEQFEGSYEGIGIEFIILNKVLTVVSPIVGGPSEAVGLLPGDQIIRIEDESAYGITEDEVQDKLRGPKGSKVKVSIRRPSQPDPFEVTITRDKIPIYSLTSAFMLDDGITGYIWLSRFAKTTAQELTEALDKLEAQGMKQLIFDLRHNSGGYLEQAFAVADKFIPGGYKIVYTRGRLKSAGEDFYSTDRNTYSMFPLVVLINSGSASASEIVAGAVQDLDRGLILGETSFGKGLVQNQIPLKDGSALRLTVARYYTPSGRLIQRPYDDGLMDYYTDALDDSVRNIPDSTKVYQTLAGRTVYGGGGITPDIFLKPSRITRFTNQLIGRRIFFEFGSNFASRNRELADDFEKFKDEFRISDAMLDELKALIDKAELEFSGEAFEKDLDYIKLMMKADIARHLWDSEHYYMIRITGDDDVRKAIEKMPEAIRIGELHAWKDD